MRKITPEDLFEFQLVGQVTIHPHSDQVVYQQQQASREDNKTHSHLMSVTPGSEPRPFTQGTSDSSPQFSPDGKLLAFLSRRSGSSQIWVMSTSGGEARQVTKIDGGVETFRWHPSSERLIYIALIGPDGITEEKTDESDDPYIKFNRDVKVITEQYHKLDGVGYYTEKRPHLVIQDLSDDKNPKQLTHGPMRHDGLSISHDGTMALTATRYGEDYDLNGSRPHLYLIDLSGQQEPKALTTDPLSVGEAIFSQDDHTIYFEATNADDLGYDNVNLYRIDRAGQGLKQIASQWDRPFADLSISDMPAPGSNPMILDSDESHLYVLTTKNGTTQLAKITLATDDVELMTDADQVFYSYDIRHDGRYAALCTTTPTNPGRVLWLDLSTHALSLLADPNKDLLSEITLSEPQRFSAHAENGPELDAWVMKPVGLKEGETAPTALEIHGGPMMMYAQSFFFEFQCLAAQGYGVVYSNPRGSQGYGRDFCGAIQREWGHLDYDDIMAALDTAIANEPWIDTSRLGVLGGSYGGYMTNWILGHSDRFKAAITMRSVVDWATMIGTGDLGWHWIKRADGVWPYGGDDAWYRQQSPITYVENITTPLLIEHQEGDLRCPIEQGEMLFTAMKYFGKAPVKFIRYPNEFHGMSRNGKPWHRVYRLNTFAEWFQTYL